TTDGSRSPPFPSAPGRWPTSAGDPATGSATGTYRVTIRRHAARARSSSEHRRAGRGRRTADRRKELQSPPDYRSEAQPHRGHPGRFPGRDGGSLLHGVGHRSPARVGPLFRLLLGLLFRLLFRLLLLGLLLLFRSVRPA